MVARETRRLAAKTVLDTKQNGRVPCGVLTAVAAVAEDGRRTLDRKPVTHHDNSSATIGRTRGSAGAYKVMMRRNQPPPVTAAAAGGGGGPDRGHGYARHSSSAAAAASVLRAEDARPAAAAMT